MPLPAWHGGGTRRVSGTAHGAIDAIDAEAIRTLYDHATASAVAAMICAACIGAAAWAYNDHAMVTWWLVAQLAMQGVRYLMLRAYHARTPTDTMLARWADVYTIYMLMAGAIWGAAAILFIHTDQPITMIYTLCALFAITGGSVPSNAYHPLAFNCFIGAVFGGVLVRFLPEPQFIFRMIGLSCVAFAGIMILFCRAHTATIYESLRIRFDNRDLVLALTRKTQEVEAALAEARRASLSKSQFLAAASHDLRQPLYALSLFSASLSALKLDDEGRKVVSDIQDSVLAMESLFVGLLDLSKLEAGVVRPRLALVSIDALFDRLSQYFRPVAMERGLDLRFRSDGEWVTSDEALIEQVMSNLVANALRATVTGTILVAARSRSRTGQLRLEVWDTGVGIDPHDRERIFDEFVQLGNPERDRRKGLGLGLSIARRSAALIGSVVDVASRPGIGSRFTITQPLANTIARPIGYVAAPARVIPERLWTRALPLLVIEDDRDVRVALGGLLTRWGVRFDEVPDARTAIHLVEQGRRYGLILADFRLAGALDGLDLIAALRRIHPKPLPPAVLITGDSDPALIARADRQGVPLLHKPLRPADLRVLLGLDHIDLATAVPN